MSEQPECFRCYAGKLIRAAAGVASDYRCTRHDEYRRTTTTRTTEGEG